MGAAASASPSPALRPTVVPESPSPAAVGSGAESPIIIKPSSSSHLPSLRVTPSKKTTPPSTLFPSYGIKLSYWKDFVNDAGGRERFAGMNSKQACEEIVIPMTKNDETSYCKMLLKQCHGAVGIADVFVLHDWRYDFLHVLDSLLYHFRDDEDIIVWFDVFSINHHVAQERNVAWWKDIFLSELCNIGHTVLILPPWQDPNAASFKCASCLFVLYHSMHHKCKFNIALKKEDAENLSRDLTFHTDKVLHSIQSKIDVVHSQSAKVEDKRVLFQLIEEDVGFNTINQTIYKHIREWLTQFFSDEFERLSTGSQPMVPVAIFNQTASLSTSTIATVEHSITAKADDLTLLYMQIALAYMLVEGGKFSIALSMYQEAHHRILVTYGEAHPIALQCLHGMAALYQRSGDCNLAEKAYLDCADLCKHTQGRNHPDNLKYSLALGDLYRTQGEEKKAEMYYANCLRRVKELYGNLHPDNLLYMNRLALLYFQQLKDKNAELLLNECVSQAKQIYGECHADTIKIMDDLAQIYSGQGKYDQALSLERECYHKCLEVFGEVHVDSLAVLINLSKLYDIIGQLEDAQTLYKQSLDISRSLLGEKNPYAHSLQRSLSRLDKKLHRQSSEGRRLFGNDGEVDHSAPTTPMAASSPNHHHQKQHSYQDTSPVRHPPQRKILILSPSA